MVSGKKYPF